MPVFCVFCFSDLHVKLKHDITVVLDLGKLDFFGFYTFSLVLVLEVWQIVADPQLNMTRHVVLAMPEFSALGVSLVTSPLVFL